MVAGIILAVVIGYLLGSIPCAYIAGRLAKGVDIRKVGGGNVGALNVMREIGTAAGLAVFLADAAKGSLAVLVARWLGVPCPGSSLLALWPWRGIAGRSG